MRRHSVWWLSVLALAIAACGSNDDNGTRPTATRTAAATATATQAPTGTATQGATVSATPTSAAATATASSAPTHTATAVDTATAVPTPTATPTVAATPTSIPDAAGCERAAASGLAECISERSAVLASCYQSGGHICASDDQASADVFALLASTVAAACPDAATVHAVGYGDQFTPAGLTTRLQEACSAESAALAVRSFGGPQGASIGAADATGRSCIAAAHQAGVTLLHDALASYNACLDNGACDAGAVADHIAALQLNAENAIAAECTSLQSLIALDVPSFSDRASAQARCLTAIAHPDTAPLSLDCGPREALPETPRGQYVQVVLDEATYGTRCGDGSPYAFWIRLAPEGSPVDQVVVGMQGGGVCVFEDDCATRPADLFESLSDQPETTGPLSNDAEISPFANWTKVYLPYCTQDVFIGGGATSNFASITVERFGAVDVRGAMRAVRDILWRDLDQTHDGGYTPDHVRTLFGGFSAGGFGTIYNYHWVLDDLQWAHTAAYPDAGLALDNGQPLGVAALGALVVSDTPPFGWGARNFLPPYCFATNCGVGPILLEKTSPRLKAVPEQQMLILSNQVDQTQVDTTYFANIPDWVNALRASYCATHALPGIQYFLPAITESTHVISTRNEIYTGHPVDGVIMRDWLASGFTSPDTITDQIEEGTLVTDIPGVEPFACE
ncbi:MAG: pectin acetylesterase-family hydrolase [bacterium]